MGTMSSYEEQQRKNREEVLGRKRQWQAVGDSDEEQQRKDALNSLLESESSDSDSSSSNSSRGSSAKKHAKKEKKNKKKEKKEKKSSKKHRKDHKKDKKKVKESVAINQNEYGKYGIIREQDFFAKQREFEAYMNEVKNQPGIMGQGRAEVMRAFKDFIEDYNTVTMPHEKFYNYEKWETMDYQRKKMAEVQGGVRSSLSNEDGSYNAADDEANRKAELKRKK